MELFSQPAKALGPSEIARDWTARGHKVSRQYVDKLMRKGVGGEKLAGEHVLSLDAAWLWRTQRTDFQKQPAGGARETTPAENKDSGGGDAAENPEAGGDDSLDSELMRVKHLVLVASRVWRDALAARPYDAFAASRARKEYLEAVSTRIEVEGLIGDYRKSLGLVVDLVDAQRMLDQRLVPLRGALQNLDKELAKEFYPEDPARHRPRFRRVISRVVVASQAIARAKKRLVFPAHVGARAA